MSVGLVLMIVKAEMLNVTNVNLPMTVCTNVTTQLEALSVTAEMVTCSMKQKPIVKVHMECFT